MANGKKRLVVRVGFDRDVFGTIMVGTDGKFVFNPTKAMYRDELERIARSHAEAMAKDPERTDEEVAAFTAEDVLRHMLDTMQAKHLWAEEAT